MFNLPKIGVISPRNASSVGSSPWGIGTETMDRNFTVFANWSPYLNPLGVKRARLEGGWGRCEPVRGQYNWGWLDDIITKMAEIGVKPWVTLVFNNPVYNIINNTHTAEYYESAGAPLPDLANLTIKAGWVKWVQGLAARYKKYGVDEFEVWNEPDCQHMDVNKYGQLLAVTTDAVLAGNPDAKTFLQIAGDISFATSALKAAKNFSSSSDAFMKIEAATYHPYSANPDSKWAKHFPETLLASLAAVSPTIRVIQGESGAPSVKGGYGALATDDWNELSQAKWALRRLLSDWGHKLQWSSLFSIADMCYMKDGKLDMNHKGILEVDCTTKKVIRPKQAYFAIQHLTAIIDDNVTVNSIQFPKQADSRTVSVINATHKLGHKPVYVIWSTDHVDSSDAAPSNVTTIIDSAPISLELGVNTFDNPVLIDILNGTIYSLQSCNGGSSCEVPVYDSPVVVAENNYISYGWPS